MKIIILGGGISGLASAFFLRQKHPRAEIVLFEKENRLGGCIETKETKGFSFELGPRTFQLSRCPCLLQLIDDLYLRAELIFSDPEANKRYLWHQDELRSISSFWPQLIFAGLRDLCMPKAPLKEESIAAFAQRRFGKEAAELFFDSMAKGVFAGDMQTLSLDACFPSLREWEQQYRSLVKAAFSQKKKQTGLFTLRSGMSRLIEALASISIDIHTGHAVQEIRSDGIIAQNRFWPADAIISALPGNEIARLCGIDLSLRNESLCVVNLGYEEEILPQKGYGYLIPSLAKEALLGQIWDSSVFGLKGQTKLTSMVKSAAPTAVAIEAMKRHLAVHKRPDAIWEKEAWIPQYELGHMRKIAVFEKQVRERFPKLFLTGNYLEGPSVESCIYRAKKVGDFF